MKKIDKDRTITVLGKGTFFDGKLQFTKELRVEGHFSGSIDSQGILYIAKNAVCKVQYIKAASIIIDGSVEGSLSAADKIEMKPGSSVHGSVTAVKIKIADGVSFEGAVRMIHDSSSANPDLFSTYADQFKNKLMG